MLNPHPPCFPQEKTLLAVHPLGIRLCQATLGIRLTVTALVTALTVTALVFVLRFAR